ncbi:MAG: Asp-tRNA(Asn)/Glu-tRNA(Gln) amidotransferase subunit GatA [Heliobacteriaceae bacterium]|jgi:aspartyl-tRNA(Asn)/glutamyl-tRNA(Gln) amidotransferase subunit A|nr:Asp-tRNA(Asn)/Glu-tRNA(Gln) amidotransferase subunit GatA [Heliobacteriaceae bacterium]
MNMNELLKKSATEQSKALRSKEISAVELTTAAFERINELDEKLGTFNSLTKETALETARKVDEKIARNEELPLLAGVPLALKDNMNLAGSRTTASSKILENFVSPYNATITEKLLNNLVPIVGKANLDEFAMGSSNENSAFRKVYNPWDLKRVPGGSSGGSAASVASCEATLALGSDTGGSIRLPASFCGIVGMKPTYGKVSRYGLIAFASSLDQIGPFARTVEDAANLLEVISGHDPKDSTSLNLPVERYSEHLSNDIHGLKIGVIKELMTEGLSEDVAKAVERAIDDYKKLGAQIVEISLPNIKHSIGIYYILATAECSSNLARFDGVKYGYRTPNAQSLMEMYTKTRAEGFGPEVKRRIMLGTYALSSGYYDAYYKKAQQMRALVTQDFIEAFKKVDILLSPTCPNTAFKMGEKADDPLAMYLTDIATISANLAGIPGLSVPCGFDRDGMPIGLQLLAPQLHESKLFNAAHKFERANDYYLQLAKI